MVEQEVVRRAFRLDHILQLLASPPRYKVEAERVFSHLTHDKLDYSSQSHGMFEAYPGVALSIHELLCRHIRAQHPGLGALPGGVEVQKWLLDTPEGQRLGLPDDTLSLASLGQANIHHHLLAVTASENYRPLKTWLVDREDPDEHRIDGWSPETTTGAVYYLTVWSLRAGESDFALSVAPSGKAHYVNRLSGRPHPFRYKKPAITAEHFPPASTPPAVYSE